MNILNPQSDTVHLRHNRKCMVCGEPALFLSPDSEPVCLRAQCRLVLNKKKELNETAYKQFFSLHATQIKRTNEMLELRKKRLVRKREKENKEDIAYWEEAININNGYDPKDYPFMVLPSNSRKITTLPEQRKNYFYKSLSQLAGEIQAEFKQNDVMIQPDLAEPDQHHDMEEEPLVIEGKACSLCKGSCCSIGEEHAFIKKRTLQNYLAARPNLEPWQAVSAYMAFLPEKSFEDACVFQTLFGCALPRHMRSNVCNDYLCKALIQLITLYTDDPVPKGIFFINRALDHWAKDDPDLKNPIVGSVLIVNDRSDKDPLREEK